MKTKMREIKCDGWSNAVSGMGHESRDRSVHTVFDNTHMAHAYADNLYSGDRLAQKIVGAPVDDAFGASGFAVSIPDDGVRTEAVAREIKRLKLNKKVKRALKVARRQGGAALLPVTERAFDISQPRPVNVGAIKTINILEPRDLQVIEWQEDPSAIGYDEPRMYSATSTNGNLLGIHASWLIPFQGLDQGRDQRRENSGWGASVLKGVHTALQAFMNANLGASHLITESSQSVYSIEGLLDILANAEDANGLHNRLTHLDFYRSVYRAIILDKENETFERKPVTFSGLAEVVDRASLLLSAYTDIPLTRLLGRAPAGMNATGESDAHNYHKLLLSIRSEVEENIGWVIDTLVANTVKQPETWEYSWPSLEPMTLGEEAEYLNKMADVNQKLSNVLLEEELAESWQGRIPIAIPKVDPELRASRVISSEQGEMEIDGQATEAAE